MLGFSAVQLAALLPQPGPRALEIAPDIYVLRPDATGVAEALRGAAAASPAWRAAEINADLEVNRAVRDADVLGEVEHPQLIAACRDRLFAATRDLASALVPRTVLAEVQVVRYVPGGTYVDHRDTPAPGATPRALSLVWYLNDGFGGGETAFVERDVALQPLAGLVVAFRPELLHRAEPVTTGTKYAVTAWYHVPPAR
jgi:prolyl 4-hydroxylase